MGKKKKSKKKTLNKIQSHTDPVVRSVDDMTDAEMDQSNEMEALQAIYGGDYSQRETFSKYGCFSIQTKALLHNEKDKIFAEVKLLFTYTRNYPNDPPIVELEDPKGLSDNELTELIGKINAKAESLVGEVMVHELIMITEEYLTEHNSNPQISLIDQMLEREDALAKQLEDRERREAEEREKEMKLAAEEAERLQQDIEEAIKQRKRDARHRRNSEKDQGLTEPVKDQQDGWSTGDDEVSSQGSVPAVSNSRYHSDFKEIRLLGRGGCGEVILAKNRLDKRQYAVKKIRLEDDEEENRKIRREVTTISRMFHSNIVRYYQAWKEGGEGSEQLLGDDAIVNDLQTEGEQKHHAEEQSSAESSEAVSMVSDSDSDAEVLGLGWFVSPSNSNPKRNSKKKEITKAFSDSDDSVSDLDSSGDSFGAVGGIARVASCNSDWGFDFGLQRKDPFREMSSEKPSKPSQPTTVVSSEESNKKPPSYLFIQMEYCEHTLKDLIDQNELWKRVDEAWRLFRQMVEALAYIHKEGVLHRDMKPPNIFLDKAKNVKVGDFGLAAFGLAAQRDRPEIEQATNTTDAKQDEEGPTVLERQTSRPSHIQFGELEEESPLIWGRGIGGSTNQTWEDSMTGGIGTAFYRAPEQELSGHYNFKADMFSLGIIFYEMLRPPFRTYMERADVLTNLRDGKLEEEFIQRVPENAVKVIKSLVEKNPRNRPTARKLLSSELLPSKLEVEDQYLEEVMSILSNPQSSSYELIIRALFDQESVEQKELKYDYDIFSNVRKRTHDLCKELIMRERLSASLRQLFASHNAIPLAPPTLRPREHIPRPEAQSDDVNAATSRHAVNLVDMSGNVVVLPDELTTGFARFAARSGLLAVKRYHIGPVYFRADPTVAQCPKENVEAAFDIVIQCNSEESIEEAAEAEVVGMALQAMTLVSPELSPYYLRLSHTNLSHAVLDLCGVDIKHRKHIYKIWHRIFLKSRKQELTSHDINNIIDVTIRHLKGVKIQKEILANVRTFLCIWKKDPADALQEIENQINKLPVVMRLRNEYKGVIVKQNSSARKSAVQLKNAMDGILHIKNFLKIISENLGYETSPVVAGSPKAGSRLRSGSSSLPMGIPAYIQLDLGMNHRLGKYSGGMLFQVVVLSASPANKALNQVGGGGFERTCVAEGGRFEELITRNQTPYGQYAFPPLAAVGVRFALEKMAACLALLQEPQPAVFGGGTTPKGAQPLTSNGAQLDALIWSEPSLDEKGVLYRLEVAQHLWKAGLRADYLPKDSMFGPSAELSLDQLMKQCAKEGVPYIVFVREHLLRGRGEVKLLPVLAMGGAVEMVKVEHLAWNLQKKLGTSGGDSGNLLGPSMRGLALHDSSPSGTVSAPTMHHSLSNSHDPPNIIMVDRFKGTETKKAHKELCAMERRVARSLESMGLLPISTSGSHQGPGAPGPRTVLVCEATFDSLRDFSSVYMTAHDLHRRQKAIQAVCEQHSKHRKSLKHLQDALQNIETSCSSASTHKGTKFKQHAMKVVYLYSVPDDRFDMLYLNPIVTHGSNVTNSGKHKKGTLR